MNMSKKKSTLLIVVLVSIFLILLFFTFTIFVGFLYPFSDDPIPQISNINTYVLTESKLSGDLIRHGFVQLPQVLEKEEFVTYSTEDSSFFTISNSGGDEYECTGSCYCQDSHDFQRRNVHSTVLTRGLRILLLAFSGTMALNIANEAFREDCVKRFSAECSDDEKIVLSKDEYCKKVEESNLKMKSERKYLCRGHCHQSTLSGLDSNNEKILFRKGREKFGSCEEKVLESFITPFEDAQENMDLRLDENEARKNTQGKTIKFLFIRKKLEPFCQNFRISPSDKEINDWIIANRKNSNPQPEDVLKIVLDQGNLEMCMGMEEGLQNTYVYQGLEGLFDPKVSFKNVECFESP